MPIDVSTSVTIARPRHQVAAYVIDPANDLTWIRALSSAELQTGYPIQAGSKVRRVAKMAGRKIDYTTEVTRLVEGEVLEMRTVAGPFPMLVTYSFSDEGDVTRVEVRNRGGSGPLFALFGWAIGRVVNGRVQGDLQALKRAIESRPDSAP